MKVVRLTLVALVSLCLAVGVATAQEKKHRGHGKTDRAMMVFGWWEHALQVVDLTPEQQTQWEALKKEFAPKTKKLLDKMDHVLTPAQKKASEAAAEAAMAAGKSREEVGQAAQEAAKVTDEQKAKFAECMKEFKSLRTEFRGKILDILTPEQQELLPEPPQPPQGEPRQPPAEE